MTTWLIVAVVLVIVTVVFLKSRDKPPEEPSLPFGPTGDGALDFDSLDAQHPLSAADLARLNPENIETFNQDQIDQIYARLDAGPIPDGPYRGSFFFSEGSDFRNLADVLGSLRGGGIDFGLDLLTGVGEMLWQGKVFYREPLELRNIIDKELIVGALFGVSKDEMVIAEVFDDEVALLFPAKLYTGHSQFDPRKSSVIIDYAETAQIDGYIEKIDRLVGKQGLQIRDEIRMLRPGFYLGRAYFGSLFGLNFTLYNEDVARGSTTV